LLGLGFVFASNDGSATGHFPLISWSRFIDSINAYKANQRKLNVWVGEEHVSPHGNYLATDINTSIEFQNFIKEGTETNVSINTKPSTHPEIIRAQYTKSELPSNCNLWYSSLLHQLSLPIISAFMVAASNVSINTKPSTHPEIIRAQYTQEKMNDLYPHIFISHYIC
jgi:hypothetical protein